MSLGFINPADVRKQTLETKRSSLPGVGFQDVANAVGGTGATAVAVAGDSQKSYQSAAVMQAAISGVAGTPGAVMGTASNAPYYSGTPLSTAGSPFVSGGYDYGSVPGAGGYVGATVPGGSVGAGVGIGVPSQDYQEKQALFQQMNDANWEMLVAQVTVSNISRDYQARSNILKTKSDTELNAVRNMRA